MRVLLINPSQEKVYGMKLKPAYPPLGILYIGTVLKDEGHTVKLVDIDSEGVGDQKFSKILGDFEPEVIGISSVTPTFKNALHWAALAKKARDIPVVMGGVHPSVKPEETLENSCVDIVVVGEGELTAKELFNRLSESRVMLDDIKGIYFRQGDRVVANAKRPLIGELDSLPFPDRSLLSNPNAFSPPDAIHLPVTTIMASRGCPGECTFCCTKLIFSRRLRLRSVENVANEVSHLVDNEGYREIHIADDHIAAVKKWLLNFCEEIRRRGLAVKFQLMNGVRADHVDREVLNALKGIGVTTVGYGVETGNESILKNIKKGIPLDATRRAFELSKELGLETWAFIIFGLPGETVETIKETIRFVKELDPDFVKFLILKPYPQTEVYSQLRKDNLILSYDYDLYGTYTSPVHKLPGLEPKEMIYWQKRAFREFYLRPRKIIAHAIRIKSLTQIKLLMRDFMFAVYCMFARRPNAPDVRP